MNRRNYPPRCKAIGCIEVHEKHYCKICHDEDSYHLSSKCPSENISRQMAPTKEIYQKYPANSIVKSSFLPPNSNQITGDVYRKNQISSQNYPTTQKNPTTRKFTVLQKPYNNFSNSYAINRTDPIKGYENTNLRNSFPNNTSLTAQNNNYGVYGTYSAKKHCKVADCTEEHPYHFCRICNSQDSDHFSSACPIKIEENKVDPGYSQPSSFNRSNRFDKNYSYSDKYQQPQSFTNKGSETRKIAAPSNQMRYSSIQPTFSRNVPEYENIAVPKYALEDDDIAVAKSKSYVGKGIKLPNGDQLRWREISTILKELQSKSARINLEECLKSLYNSDFLKLSGFKMFIDENKLRRKIDFSNTVLPFMAKMALKLPEFFPSAELKILPQQSNGSVSLTKDQVCCLLAHMFFGTISNNSKPKMQETMNFKEVLSNPSKINVQKLYCLFNYFFNAATQKSFGGEIVYSRSVEFQSRFLDEWTNSRRVLQDFEIDTTGKIENNTSNNTLEVDFANKFIGGGALDTGAVQEEIRFFISPECIPSMLFFENFEDNEVGYIKGTEKVNWCEGYSINFEFRGDFKAVAKDNILVMDAIKFNGLGEQFTERNILREVNKAFLGFSGGGQKIITGKWGCGAFKGDPQLKFLIQWMACSELGKKMKFCSFGEKSLGKTKEMLYKFRTKTVGDLMKKILAYKPNRIDLFEYLMK